MAAFNSIERQRLLAYGLQHGQFPNPLYKYTSVANLRLILENQTLKFSCIADFNDKRECFATLDFNCSRSDWANYIVGLNPELPIRQLAAMVNSVVSNPDLGRQWITAAIKGANCNLGILCLTVRNDNTLMWAHYADCNRGVCLQFDISRDLDTFCFPKQVIYDDKVRRFNYIRSWNLRKGMDATEAIFHKSAEWSYEQEYRVVRINGVGIVPFDIASLRNICFGIDTPAAEIAEIRALCQRKNYTHISFSQITLDEDGNFVIETL